MKTKKNSISLNPENFISPDRQKVMKSPLPKITDSLSNYDKAAFLKKINAMRNLKADKMNLIEKIKIKSMQDNAAGIVRTRNTSQTTD